MYFMFSARRKGSNPRMGVGMDMGMHVDMGVGTGGCANGGTKWPGNQQVAAIGDSE